MSALQTATIGLACVFVFISLAWVVQWRTRNAGIVDAVWSWSLGFLGALYALLGSAPAPQRALLGLMAALWGLRLGTHLFLRNHGKPEDRRYKKFRDGWGDKADFNFYFFFHFQTLFAMLLSAAFLVAAFNPAPLAAGWLALAAAIWLLSVLGEGIADRQMERFRGNPANRGQVCRDGLWRYSRHPNYFFECLHWLAYLPLAIGSSWWWAALVSPLVMWWLLMKMSGIPILEAHMAASKPGYAEYMRTTSALIPWPPKQS
ncbi:MAG TPA: DUF1295 domain-containing protein [Solimonas sp.]|nr:DUF1295 domain-containing protein [Solimonas sp.]